VFSWASHPLSLIAHNTERKIMSNKAEKKVEDLSKEPEVGANPATDPKIVQNPTPTTEPNKEVGIAKPGKFSLEKFKSKRGATIADVETRPSKLPVMKISDADDFVRLHPDEDAYWSGELCFVHVPVKGGKGENLHLIDEELAMRYLDAKKIQRFRLALASKTYDVHFLCKVPTRNLDNKFNETALKACEDAKTLWTEAVSRKSEGVDEYKIKYARNPKAFPEPKWPSLTLEGLIGITFEGRMIESDDHPGLLRLIGEKQDVS
jgi:hypothetical protein